MMMVIMMMVIMMMDVDEKMAEILTFDKRLG
jgi:hypothetical protein